MVEPSEPFDPAEVEAAEHTDAEIEAVLAGSAGRGVTSEVLLLANAIRTDPPAALAARIEAAQERTLRQRWRPFRWVAALMGYLFFSQGFGNIVWGNWVADGIGEDFSPHITREGGLALMAVGVAVASGALVRRMAPVSAAAGVPLAIAFGVAGIGEIGVFAAGAVLHISQGLVGIALGVTFWRYRRPQNPRDTSGGSDEGGA